MRSLLELGNLLVEFGDLVACLGKVAPDAGDLPLQARFRAVELQHARLRHQALGKEIDETVPLAYDRLDLRLIGRLLALVAHNLFLELGDPLLQNLFLSFDRDAPRLELVQLALDGRADIWVVAAPEKIAREADRAACELCQKSRFGRLHEHELLGVDFELGLGLSVVKHEQYVASVHSAPLLDADILDDAAVEVLDALAVSRDLDDALPDDGAVQRRSRRPGAEAAEEDDEDRQSRADGAARRIAWRWLVLDERMRIVAGEREILPHVKLPRRRLRSPAPAGWARLGSGRDSLATTSARSPKSVDGAVAQQKNLVDNRQRRRPMRDDDDRGAALLQLRDTFGERRVALGVEVGARLVENDEARLAEDGAGQRDALSVAARQDGAALADLRVVAVREPEDHLVDAGNLRRRDHLDVHFALEAADIGGDAVGEKLDVLRQITEMAAERAARPGGHVGAIQAHGPGGRLQHADQLARQRRLSGARRADHAERFARLDLEAHAPQDRLVCAGRHVGERLDRQAAGRPRQRERLVGWRRGDARGS